MCATCIARACRYCNPKTRRKLQFDCRFFIVLSYAWGWLLSGERPDKGGHLHALSLDTRTCSAVPWLQKSMTGLTTLATLRSRMIPLLD